MKFSDLNSSKNSDLEEILYQCCGSQAWVDKLLNLRPYKDENDLIEKSNFVWYNLKKKDWLEAFSNHPEIGDLESLKRKYSKQSEWSRNEQGSVSDTNPEVLMELQSKNKEYLQKNGFIFIVFATGKTAEEMLDILKERLEHSTKNEFEIAAREQNKITRLRIKKLLSD